VCMLCMCEHVCVYAVAIYLIKLRAWIDFKERFGHLEVYFPEWSFVYSNFISYELFCLRSAHQQHSMAGSLRMFVATLLPLLVCFTTCSDHTNHYVKPTANIPCPADPCLTLSEYAKQTHHYLTSNTALVFLPGDHVLSVNFTVENVNDVEIYAQQTLTADNYAGSRNRIVCQGLVGFTFRNISHMKVHGLTFNSCGKGAVGRRYDTDHDYLTIYGVSVYLGQHINILNCMFQDSIGTALGVFYSSLVLKGSFTTLWRRKWWCVFGMAHKFFFEQKPCRRLQDIVLQCSPSVLSLSGVYFSWHCLSLMCNVSTILFMVCLQVLLAPWKWEWLLSNF